MHTLQAHSAATQISCAELSIHNNKLCFIWGIYGKLNFLLWYLHVGGLAKLVEMRTASDRINVG
jgi:hypothetical protein